MDTENPVVEKRPKSVPKHPSSADLSAEIARSVQKQPGELVKCRRVSGSAYRCNWFTPDTTPAEGGARFTESYRIRDSRFLRARKVDGQLVIEDITVQSAKSN